MKPIETKRLILRAWKEEDAIPFFELNQDPKVVEFLPKPVSMEQVRIFMEKWNTSIEERKFCFFATELKSTGELIGMVGLGYVDWEAPFTPAVEIGWRLSSQHWGKGYATEGAFASLDYGFNTLELPEIVAFTVPSNTRSRRVMDKIGLKRDMDGDFLHPKLEPDHKFAKHVLYRIKKGS